MEFYATYFRSHNLMLSTQHLGDPNYTPEYYDELVNLLLPFIEITTKKSPSKIYRLKSVYPISTSDHLKYEGELFDNFPYILGSYSSSRIEEGDKKYKHHTVMSTSCGASIILDIMSELYILYAILTGDEDKIHASIFSLLIYMNYFAPKVTENDFIPFSYELFDMIESKFVPKEQVNRKHLIQKYLNINNCHETGFDYSEKSPFDDSNLTYLDLVILYCFESRASTNTHLNRVGIRNCLDCDLRNLNPDELVNRAITLSRNMTMKDSTDQIVSYNKMLDIDVLSFINHPSFEQEKPKMMFAIINGTIISTVQREMHSFLKILLGVSHSKINCDDEMLEDFNLYVSHEIMRRYILPHKEMLSLRPIDIFGSLDRIVSMTTRCIDDTFDQLFVVAMTDFTTYKLNVEPNHDFNMKRYPDCGYIIIDQIMNLIHENPNFLKLVKSNANYKKEAPPKKEPQSSEFKLEDHISSLHRVERQPRKPKPQPQQSKPQTTKSRKHSD